MNLENLYLWTHGIIIVGSLLAIIYTFGVVWRVEKKLDTSYKLMLAAIIAFCISEILDLFSFEKHEWQAILGLILKALFVILFLAGILEMRSMLRKMDGEIK